MDDTTYVPEFIPPPGAEKPERNDCEIIVVLKALTYKNSL